MNGDRIVLVTGATGRQGGAVIRHMAGRGWRLRALTRSPDKPASRALTAQGIEVVAGDLEDARSIQSAVAGAWGVFSVQDPWQSSVTAEIRQGLLLADQARAAGVSCYVQASVATAERRTDVPHFESKGTIERYATALGLRPIALRPVFFMDSLIRDFDRRAKYVWGALSRALQSTGRIQLIATDDIGRVAAEAFADPDRYAGQAIELAGDSLTMPAAVELYRRRFGVRPRSRSVPFWLVNLANHEAAVNFRWVGSEGWNVDIAGVRARYPWVKTFEQWLAGLPPASR